MSSNGRGLESLINTITIHIMFDHYKNYHAFLHLIQILDTDPFNDETAGAKYKLTLNVK